MFVGGAPACLPISENIHQLVVGIAQQIMIQKLELSPLGHSAAGPHWQLAWTTVREYVLMASMAKDFRSTCPYRPAMPLSVHEKRAQLANAIRRQAERGMDSWDIHRLTKNGPDQTRLSHKLWRMHHCFLADKGFRILGFPIYQHARHGTGRFRPCPAMQIIAKDITETLHLSAHVHFISGHPGMHTRTAGQTVALLTANYMPHLL